VSVLKIIPVKLWKWFPSDDEFATKMARLCILREQLMFELQCSRDNKKVALGDDYSIGYRQTYFFVKMCNTVREINSAIERLSSDKGYKKFIKRQNDFLRKEIDELKNNLKSSLDLIIDVRDNLASHVKEKAIHTALQNMNKDRSSFFQIPKEGIIPKKTHYKFSGELILCLLIGDTPEKLQKEKLEHIVEALVKSLQTFFHRFDLLFLHYAHDRKLL
jgi:hypothetical protein